MPIVQAGPLNTTALVVPDLYVQIVPPQNLVLNGVPTNIIGVVGTANWGPVNQPVIAATMADYARSFGSIQARKYDMGTQVATAVQQGAQNFRCVRVTDGTDTAASYAFFYANGGYPALLTARYSGSLGNQIGVQLTPGSAAGTWRVALGLPGQIPENYDNLAAPSPSVFWQNLVNAINQGQGPLRGPSALCVATPEWNGRGCWCRRGADRWARRTAAPRHVCPSRPGLQPLGPGRHGRRHHVDHAGWLRTAGRTVCDPNRAGRRYDPVGRCSEAGCGCGQLFG
jgi:hypothetical protein